MQFRLNLSAPTHQKGLWFGLLDFFDIPGTVPWGRVDSCIIVIRFVFDSFVPQRHLVIRLVTEVVLRQIYFMLQS